MRSSSFARVVAFAGLVLIIAALAANQAWLDRHFLPSFFVPRQWYVWIETAVRLAIGAAGATLILLRNRIAQRVTRAPALTVQVLAAVVLAVGAGEVAVRWIQLRPTEWLRPEAEPRRQPDSQLGWVLVPNRVGHAVVSGRQVDYAVDAAGFRVRRSGEATDHEQPTIVFGGESAMFGEGLTWQESIPAQVQALTGIQSANLAVHGYSTDQIYMRLARDLPTFRQPVAVVAIFMTELFGRNLDDDRPHLAPGLTWQPAERKPRLLSMATWLVPFRRVSTVDQGVAVTREVLQAVVKLARGRGATPLIVIPQFGPEDDALRRLRTRVVTPDLPALLVQLDPDWRLPWDRHPNADAARVIGAAIAGRLRAR